MLKPTKIIEPFISKLEQRTVKSGEIIFNEGEPGEVIYGLLSGEVEIIVNGKVVEEITPGDVFGVGALVQLNHLRASTAKAKSDCQLIVVNQEKFLFLVQETPVFSLEVMRSYSARLIKLKHSI
ncbi:cyclic nucleotide-binding domain-containing protein [Gloeocapsa sp. PCC 73106]|uniref:cyclic nucleotide-binding domain-containing protein n=1 Tax=Gloeocapsa sp. PCC 73106 TaxID=102232 RepID=UPI0002ABA367|nr:cyclic nucleotide-binding domain-containing protein [Gloeocapsa sp. PCC 73106]ELR98999.1 cyclic nucleotide-binding protein [Gloeocapsa sp. PCC 73106]